MAQYEATTEELKDLASNVSPSTQAAIQSIIDSGKTVTVFNDKLDGTVTDSAVVVEKAAVNADFNAENFVAVDGTSGTANLNNTKPVDVAVEDANGLQLNVNNNADNSISLTNSDVSVETGNGNDDINISGLVTGRINTGSGDLTLTLDQSAQEQAEISVDAGDGFDIMSLFGPAIKHSFSFSGGKFHMSSADVTLEDVEVVATDVNSDGVIDYKNDHITVLADNAMDSLIATLYKVGLGREAIDDEATNNSGTLGGLRWWLDNEGKFDTQESLARSFLNCDEFHKMYDGMNNEQFVNALLANAEQAGNEKLAEKYMDELSNGTDRVTVAFHLATDDAVDVTGIDGNQYIVEGFDTNA